jgi:glutamine---fructose-6-phosphate transaminase (isomerizing)
MPSQPSQPVKRCSKCVLPSSLPGSSFNEDGECAWCQKDFPNYAPIGEKKLTSILEVNRSRTGSADCLVGVSGGKDSSYVLLRMRREFGMRVEAFTYVHDGLTDFALQNAKGVCASLDVRHHLVSLPEHTHLESFRAFFQAWVKSKRPVAAAMTCVACKHLHILGTRLARDRGIPMIIWSMCPLEMPPFIPTQSPKREVPKRESMFDLGMLLLKNMQGSAEFRRAFLGDVTISVLGCLAFRPDSGYLQRRYPSVRHVMYFDYCDWDRKSIVATLKADTPWSVPDTIVTDWHSDCVFNVFKEYMYQQMLGTSYTDAFLSNQIRYGLMTREEAWSELCRSKEFYAHELLRVLPVLRLDHLLPRLDLSCFDISSQKPATRRA